MSALPRPELTDTMTPPELAALRLVEPTDDMDPKEIAAAAARVRALRSIGSLHELLEHRPELRGVYAPADFAADSIRWSA